MIAHPQVATFTVAEYLALEEASDTRHEYLNGYIYAMAGGTPEHAQMAGNIITALNNALEESPCIVYTSDVRLELNPNHYVYPDVSVSCDGRDRKSAREKYIHYPGLLAEVTSDSTELNDHLDKLLAYSGTPSVHDYLIVSHRQRLIEHYQRQDDGAWRYQHHGSGDTIALTHLGIQIDVDSVYRKVDL